jgi:hypothetical protein
MQNPEKRKNPNHSRFSYAEAICNNKRYMTKAAPVNIFISKFEQEKRNKEFKKFLQNRLSFKDVSR